MKKYNKPTVKFHTLKISTILVGSGPELKNSVTTARQLGKDRGDFFEEEETISWP